MDRDRTGWRITVPRVSHISALYLITGVCGFVDAACFLSMGGVFAEIMTGNLLFLCFAIGTGQPILGVTKYLLVIAAFLLGALAGGRLLRGPLAEQRVGFAVEWAFLVIALALTAILQPREAGLERDVVTSLLAFAMGMQNALVRRHGVPDLATNVMTLIRNRLGRRFGGGWRAQRKLAAPLGLDRDLSRQRNGGRGADNLARPLGAACGQRGPPDRGADRADCAGWAIIQF